MTRSVAEFIRYFDGVRRRTWTAVPELDLLATRIWRFLMAMVQHEVHHRSQLDCCLAAAGGEPPQIYGCRMEDVVARARGGTARIC